MAFDPIRNHAIVTVTTGYDIDDTTVVLASGHGARLPDPATEGAFNLVWWNSTDYKNPSLDPNKEIIRVTARTSDTLTVTRPAGGNSYNGEGSDNVAAAKNITNRQYKMVLTPTRKYMADFQTELNNKLGMVTVGAANATYITDGTADDVQIQSAIDYVSGLGGGVVFIRAGTFNTAAQIVLKSNVHLRGEGTATIIKATASTDFDFMRNQNWTVGTLADHDISISDLVLDGNGPNQVVTGRKGLILKSIQNVFIKNVTFQEFNGFALNTDRVQAADPVSYATNIHVHDCIFTKSASCKANWDVVAVGVDGGSFVRNKIVVAYANDNAWTTPYVNNYIIQDCFFEATNRCISIETVADLTTTHVNISNNHLSTTSNNIFMQKVSDVKINENFITTTSGYDMSFADATSTDIKVTNNTIVTGQFWMNIQTGLTNVIIDGNKFSSTASSSDGIIFRSGTTDCIVSNNFIDGTNSNKCISLDDGCNDIKIINNKMIATNWSGIFFGGDATDVMLRLVIQGNYCYNANFGAFYGTGIVQDSVITGNTFYLWENTSPGSYGALRAIFKNTVIDGNSMINNSAGRGIVELTGSTGNIISNNTIGSVSTPIVLISGSQSRVVNNIGVNPIGLYAQGNITGATTFTRVNGNVITATLTGNVTTTMTNGLVVGDELTLVLTQDATGGRTMTTAANMKPGNGGTITLSLAAAAVDVITFSWDGTNWREKSRAMAVKQPRTITVADATSITPAGATTDICVQTNTQAIGTLTVNAPTGTPHSGQIIILQLKSTNVQTFSWNAIYRSSNDVVLPTASTGSDKTDKIMFMYNATDSKWDIMAKSLGY